ncbi:hypothetical protein BaRGS_00005094 [Batillaria attramentaria]|uniref:Apple domain-containing protein n=1 Tax=Batillaria attramentaria TaxID=370345 RepID=A0ABD0LV69_9CAEN
MAGIGFPIAIALLVVSADCAVLTEDLVRAETSLRDHTLDNTVFSDNLMFETSARSRFDCSLRCLGYVGCVSFTFMTPSAKCRGHSSVPTSASPNSPSPGAETWVYYSTTAGTSAQTTSTESTTVSDCPLENGPAHVGCSESDLQTTYLTYPHSGIVGHEEDQTTVASAQDCIDWCSEAAWCRVVEYWHTSSNCQRMSITILDETVHSSDWLRGFSYTDIYQKKCA